MDLQTFKTAWPLFPYCRSIGNYRDCSFRTAGIGTFTPLEGANPFQGEVVAALAKELGAAKAAVLFDVGNDYVKGLAEYFKASFEKMGGQVPVYEAYTKDDTDFSAALSKVADAKVDVLFLPDYYNKVSLIGKQAKEKGITAVMMGGDGWDSTDLDVAAADGGFYSNHYDAADTRPIVQAWLKDYAAEYKGAVPDALATLAYDATNLMLQAISQTGADDPVKVKDTLAGIKFEAVSGTITFDAQHNPIKSAVVIGVKDGKKTYAGTVNP